MPFALVAVAPSCLVHLVCQGRRRTARRDAATIMSQTPKDRWIVIAFFIVQGWAPANAQPLSASAATTGIAPVVDSHLGVPVIQIVPPSAGGISHNRFQAFNIGASGVILNNSGAPSQTQLAGHIPGNPMLGKAHAKAILNEVIGADPSQLRGMLEVAGPAAHVIVANPAGITCNGCGFLNASRATLTTGRPEIGPKGELAFEVRDGSLKIEGAGLKGAHVRQVDLLARALQINAGVWADQLRVVVGPARVEASSGKVRAIAVSGKPPAVALDTAALGGMYANSIRLVGTETGVGVNIGGDLVALTGNLTMNAAGDVRIAPATTLTAKTKLSVHTPGHLDTRRAVLHGAHIDLSAQRLSNQKGSITAAGTIALKTQAELRNWNGLIAATGKHTLHAGSMHNAGGTIAGGHLSLVAQTKVVNSKGLIFADDTLSLSASVLDNASTMTRGDSAAVSPAASSGQPVADRTSAIRGLSGKTVSLQLQRLDNSTGSVKALGDLKITADEIKNPKGMISADGKTHITTRLFASREGTLSAGQQLVVNARELNALGWLNAGTDIDFTYAGSLTPQGNFIAGRDIKLALGGAFVNKRRMGAVRDLRIKAQRIRNEKTGECLGGRNVVLVAAQTLDNAGLIDGKTTRIEAGKLTNRRHVYGDTVNIAADEVINDAGPKGSAHIAARGNLNLGVGAAVNRHHSVLYAKNKLRIGRQLDTAAGVVGEADSVLNQSATIEAGASILIAAQHSRNENMNFASDTVQTSSKPKVYFSPAGTTDMYDAATTWLCDKVTPGCSHRPEWLNDDPERRLLLPSKKYPASRYGPPFGYSKARHGHAGFNTPIGLSFIAGSPERDGRSRRADQFLYPGDSPIWAVFGLEAPARLPSRSDYERAQRLDRRHRRSAVPYEESPEYKQHKQRHLELDGRARAFNRDFANRLVKDFTFYEVNEVVTQTKTVRSDPARIISAGPITLKGAVTNDKSQIASGRKLRVEGPAIHNIGATGWRTVTREGQATFTQARRSDRKAHRYPYHVTVENTPFDLPVGPLRTVMSPKLNVPARLGSDQLYGTLMAGRDTRLISQGDIHNSGTIGASQTTLINARNIVNHSGGLIQAQRIDLIARENLSNLAARIQGGTVALTAGQDVQLMSAKGAHDRGTTHGTHLAGGSSVTANALTIRAGNDIQLLAAKITVERDAHLQAGRDIRLDPAILVHNEDMANGNRHRHALSVEKIQASTAHSKGDLAMTAGQDVATRAAEVHAKGKLNLKAGRDVVIGTADERGHASDQYREKRKRLLSSKTQDTTTSTQWQQAHPSTLTGQEVQITAGRDVNVSGSNIGAQRDLAVTAGRNLTVEPGVSRREAERVIKVRKSGIGAVGGLSVGNSKQTRELAQRAAEHVPSVLGSLAHNTTLRAGDSVNITASRILAPAGNLTVQAPGVHIGAARDTYRVAQSLKTKQSGISIKVGTPFFDAMQTVQQMSDAADQAKHPLMSGLASAASALDIGGTIADIKTRGEGENASNLDKIGGVKLSVEWGKRKQSATTITQASRPAGSFLAAGKNLAVRAGAAGKSGRIQVSGSTVCADVDLSIDSQGDISLQGEHHTHDLTQVSEMSGVGIGIGVSLGGDGAGIGLQARGQQGASVAQGADTDIVPARLRAGRAVSLHSHGDTTLIGAQVKAEQVALKVGGDLRIESLQHASTYQSHGQSMGASVMVGAGVSGSARIADTRVQGSFASVAEQSGIEAGNGGFAIKVRGNTHLKGAKIASTKDAEQAGVNQFSTGTLTAQDIENHSRYKAASVALGASGGLDHDGGGLAPGASTKQGKAASTTTSGISGATVTIDNHEAQRRLTGESAQQLLERLNLNSATHPDGGALSQTWDAEKLGSQVAAEAEIIAAFTQQATQTVTRYAEEKRSALQQQIRQSTNEADIVSLKRQVSALNTQVRVVNVVIGALTGSTEIATAHAALSEAADQMREYTIADSKKFTGITDGVTTLDNTSGKSAGIRGDGFKTAGTRVDLDRLCGAANERCKVTTDDQGNQILARNAAGLVQFDAQEAGDSLAEYLASANGQAMAGLTGGIQGSESTLGGMKYGPDSILDLVHEAFGGTHDFVGGSLSGLYDQEGNARRRRTASERVVHEIWSGVALVPSIPFAMSEILPAEAWKVLNLLAKLKK